MKSSIYSNFTKIYITIAISAIVVITSINFLVLKYFIEPNEVAKAKTVTEMIAGDILAPLQIEFFSSVQKEIAKAKDSNPNILNISVYDIGTKTKFTSGQSIGCDGFLINIPIADTLNSAEIGTISVCYSDYNYKFIAKIQIIVSLIICVFIVVLTAIMLALLRKFVNPFKILANKLSEFNPANPTTIDKIDANSYEMQTIQDAVLKAIERLVHYQLWLEQEIASRTTELSEQKKLFQTLTESSPNPILMCDKSIKYANHSFLKLSGYNENEVESLNLADIFYLKDSDLIQENENEICSRYNESFLICKDKTTIPVAVSFTSLHIENSIVYIINIADLSELKQKDSILLAQSRLAAMGEMVANIAHQWRQPLNVIQGHISQAGLYSQIGILSNEDLQKTAEEIKTQVNYLSSTIDDFRNYYRSDLDSEFLASAALQKACTLVNASFANTFINLVFENKADDVYIFGSLNKFIQAIITILNNSKDAILETNSQNKIVVVTLSSDSERAVISIQDSGGGISKSVLPKVFEPYFTTKSKTQGTGIGLYMTRQIIESSFKGDAYIENKSFSYDNIQCHGANFIIKIPLRK